MNFYCKEGHLKRLVISIVLIMILPCVAHAVTKGIYIGPGIYHIKISDLNGTIKGAEGGIVYYFTDTEFFLIKGHWAKGTVENSTSYDLTQYLSRFALGYLPLNRPYNIGPILGFEYLNRKIKNTDTITWKKLYLTAGMTGYFQTFYKIRISLEALLKVPISKNTTIERTNQKLDFTPEEHPSLEFAISLNYWQLSLKGFWQYEKQEEYKSSNIDQHAFETQTFGATLTIHF